jgi:uncharacterized protein YaaR (DUF327 family)
MKVISENSKRAGTFEKKHVKPFVQTDNKGAAVFNQTLNESIEKSNIETMEKLISEIDRWAEKLLKRPVPENIFGYREKVKALLTSVIEKGLGLSSMKSRPGDKQKLLVKVNKIDKKLIDATGQILGEQKDNMDILGMTDDIRGMILDLFV